MESPAQMADEPGFDLGMLVGCVIVDNGVDQLASGDRAFDGVEEADELLVGASACSGRAPRRRAR